MVNPYVSAIVDNYNYGRYLREAIESALAQDYPNFEVIVVDDGSTDDSREVISSFGEKIVAVFKENGGQASAFNAGIAASAGELICLLDADDTWRPNKISTVVEAWLGLPKDQRRQVSLIRHPLRMTFDVPPPPHFDASIAEGDPFPVPSSDRINLLPKVPASLALIRLSDTPVGGCSIPRSTAEKLFPMPESFRINADAYLAAVLPILGATLEIPIMLGDYRVHDENAFVSSSNIREKSFAVRVALYHHLKRLGQGDPIVPHHMIKDFYRGFNCSPFSFPLQSPGQRIAHLMRNPGSAQRKAYWVLRELAWSLGRLLASPLKSLRKDPIDMPGLREERDD